MLDAVLALFAEGRIVPGAPEVAERAGVSLRSVFRYYEDTDSLIRAALERRLEVLAPLFEIPDVGQGPFEDRLTRFVECRLRLYRAVAPSARVSLARAYTSPLIAEQLVAVRAEGRTQLAAMFAPELEVLSSEARATAIAAADTLFQFEALEHLHERLELAQDAAAILRVALLRLLAAT